MGNHNMDRKGGVTVKRVVFAHDTELSLKAKGMLAIMKSFGKALVLEDFARLSRDGYSSIQRGLKEITAKGYYYSSPIRNNKGVYVKFEQKVRYEVQKPESFSEKEIIRHALSTYKIEETDLIKVNSALDILLTDKENYARLKKEINDLVELGRESAKEILKLICKKA